MPKQKGGFWPFSEAENTNFFDSNMNATSGVPTGIVQYLFYTLTLIIVVLIILVLVHYTIRPIFGTKPGSFFPGFDGSTYWKDEKALSILKDTDTPVKNMFENWSFMLDIQLDNPTANTNKPRVLFVRGGLESDVKEFRENDTILTLYPSFNTIVYLDRLTNDLYVSLQTRGENNQGISLESCVIPNIPVGKSIRLGVVVGSHMLEVYVNGYLAKSKAFSNSVAAIGGAFAPPDADILGTARVRNLKLWNRILSPSEFRSDAQPSEFVKVPIPDTCLSNS